MFVSTQDIKDTTGQDIDAGTIRIAQLMIETFVGRSEIEVDDAGDMATLARATMFQAIYIKDSIEVILEQAAVTTQNVGDSSTTFDTNLFAPYMAPMAAYACRKLSWRRSRMIRTGPLFDSAPRVRWEAA